MRKEKEPGRTREETNRDNAPSDTRPICPDFLTDGCCVKGGLCTMSNPTKVGQCLRCGAKGHSVDKWRRPRRGNPRNRQGQR
eukprot:5434304-Amphidinium_carterae.1